MMDARLDELIARLEAATGPDRRLDCEIACLAGGSLEGRFTVVGPPAYEPERYFSHQVNMDWIGYDLLNNAKSYTASTDAARSLVPEGWHVSGLSEDWRYGIWSASLCARPSTNQRKAFEDGSTIGLDSDKAEALSPALALCIAALKARAALAAITESDGQAVISVEGDR